MATANSPDGALSPSESMISGNEVVPLDHVDIQIAHPRVGRPNSFKLAKCNYSQQQNSLSPSFIEELRSSSAHMEDDITELRLTWSVQGHGGFNRSMFYIKQDQEEHVILGRDDSLEAARGKAIILSLTDQHPVFFTGRMYSNPKVFTCGSTDEGTENDPNADKANADRVEREAEQKRAARWAKSEKQYNEDKAKRNRVNQSGNSGASQPAANST